MATFNILHGRNLDDGVDVARFARVIEDLDVDVLALQEVDREQPRSGMADLTAVAAEAMGARSHRFVAAMSGVPGATWMAATGGESPDSAAYGIALLSRYPATTWQTARLPRIPIKVPVYIPGTRRIIIVDEEPRSVIIGAFETPLGPLVVGNAHLSFVPGWNRRQLRRVIDDMRRCPGPHVLTGDLNMTPAAVRRWSRLRPLADALTFPAHGPTRQLDHMLTDDPGLVVTGVHAPEVPLSDHRPLVVDLERRS
ncbi:endonuclease/exonuclease/phosphatase family protein [Mycolicibacterium sediminis]